MDILKCLNCDDQLVSYAEAVRSTKPHPKLKAIWYRDLPDRFVCGCGKTNVNLKYMRENLHALLTAEAENARVEFRRLYAPEQITDTLKRFNEQLKHEVEEKIIQKFLEENPMMFAMFHAKKIYKKPNLAGFFQADFAILDSQDQLTFVEIEKSNMELFKSKGHPRAELIHAYSQVNDWLHAYKKHHAAILERLQLAPEDVMNIRGVVIAGRTRSKDKLHLQRHRMQPPYAEISFFTFDDLSNSLVRISREIVA